MEMRKVEIQDNCELHLMKRHLEEASSSSDCSSLHLKTARSDECNEDLSAVPRAFFDLGNVPKNHLRVPPGVCFMGVENNRGRFFLPSTCNFFGGVQFERLLCDPSCSSILLYFHSTAHLEEVFKQFPDEKYRLELQSGQGVAGSHITIMFESYFPDDSIETYLCADLFPVPFPIHLNRVRFALCSEDQRYILNQPDLLNRFDEAFHQTQLRALQIREDIHATHAPVEATLVKDQLEQSGVSTARGTLVFLRQGE